MFLTLNPQFEDIRTVYINDERTIGSYSDINSIVYWKWSRGKQRNGGCLHLQKTKHSAVFETPTHTNKASF